MPGGILLLPAEPAAGLGLHHAHVLDRVAQEDGERAVDVVGALNRAVDRHAAVLGHGDDALGLDVDVLLVTGPVGALDTWAAAAKPASRSPFSIRIVLKAVGDCSGSKTGSAGSSSSVTRAPSSASRALVGQQQHRLGGVADLALDQAGLVVGDERDDVAARDVAMVHDGEARRAESSAHAGQAAAGDGRADRPGVEHAGKAEIVGVAGLTGRLADSILARHAPPTASSMKFSEG